MTRCSRRCLGNDLQQFFPWMHSDPSISLEMEDGIFLQSTDLIGSLLSLGPGGFEGLSYDNQQFRLLGGGHPWPHLRHPSHLIKADVAAVLTLVEQCPEEDLILGWPQESILDQAHPQRTC